MIDPKDVQDFGTAMSRVGLTMDQRAVMIAVVAHLVTKYHDEGYAAGKIHGWSEGHFAVFNAPTGWGDNDGR